MKKIYQIFIVCILICFISSCQTYTYVDTKTKTEKTDQLYAKYKLIRNVNKHLILSNTQQQKINFVKDNKNVIDIFIIDYECIFPIHNIKEYDIYYGMYYQQIFKKYCKELERFHLELSLNRDKHYPIYEYEKQFVNTMRKIRR